MAEKKITRKVISEKVEQTQDLQETGSSRLEATPKADEADRRKRVCFFCQSKTNPSYTDTSVLRRFTTDRVKIVPRTKSNLCSKHQRVVTKQIKYARHLSLLPFIPKL